MAFSVWFARGNHYEDAGVLGPAGGFGDCLWEPETAAEDSHLLAEEGSTKYVIVVDSGAMPPERAAARELRMHLEAVTRGAALIL